MRSTARWIVKGEKSNSIFAHSKKCDRKKNTLVMLFFGRIHTDIPQIDENFRDLCEADIQIEELDKA